MLFQSRQRSAASLQKELDSDFFLPGATRLRRAETRHVQDIGKIRPGGISRNTCQNVSSLRQQFALLSHRGEIASTTVRKGNAEGVSHEGCVILDSGSRKNSRGRLILGGTGPSKVSFSTPELQEFIYLRQTQFSCYCRRREALRIKTLITLRWIVVQTPVPVQVSPVMMIGELRPILALVVPAPARALTLCL